MIHLSYAIAQFFAIMLGAILRTVGGVILAGLLVMLFVVGVLAAARVMMRRGR